MTKNGYLSIVEQLNISKEDKNILIGLSPKTYLGEISKILEGI